MYKYSVSILILTYNHQEFIYDTLSSVEKQNFSSVQVVIGDDSSSDKTQEIINIFELKSKFDFIKLFNDKNNGITKNFNKCLESCDGKYIFLLGGDDLFCPNKIESQFVFMEENPSVVMSYHDVEVFNSKTKKKINNYSDFFKVKNPDLESLLKYGAFFAGCSVAVRNSKTLPRCDEGIKYASDWLWYIEILIESRGEIGCLNGIFSRYRRHSNNITSSRYLEQSLGETIRSLDIIQMKYPFLKGLVRETLGERMFAYGIKFILKLKFFIGFKVLFGAILTSPFSPFRFVFFRMNSIFLRLRRLYEK
jgi:glycosyltransferase involved in cell wall biosynthesis